MTTTRATREEVWELSKRWINETAKYSYTYGFKWMGLPIIQLPQDIVAMQELVWRLKPDLIIETGVARGGSLVFYASMLELIGGPGIVVGIDIDIRAENRVNIEKHPMSKRIRMIQGSSIQEETVAQVRAITENKKTVLVALDSNHTHEHVLAELKMYSPLVTMDSYIVVFDTIVEDMAEDAFPNRPWGRGNNPKTAVREFIAGNEEFVIDREIDDKLLISVSPEGYLKRVRR